MTQLLTTLAVILGSLTAGYTYRVLTLRRDGQRGEHLRAIATRMQRTVITCITPVVLINTFWALRISGGTLVLFPVLGLLSHLIGGLIGLALSRRMGHSRKQAGSMFTCGAFTNLASFGGLVAFMFYGEAGYALAALFKLFEPVVYFSIGFPLAKLFSDETPPGTKWRLDLRALAKDRIVVLPLVGITTGTLLNLSGLVRPEFVGSLISPLVMISTSMMLLSVGINMRPAAVGGYVREAVAIASLKHVLMPALMLGVGLALGYGRLNGGLPLRLLVTMGAMPVAFNSLIPPSLYGLDTDLANSCWIVSTGLFAAVVLPLLFLVSRM